MQPSLSTPFQPAQSSGAFSFGNFGQTQAEKVLKEEASTPAELQAVSQPVQQSAVMGESQSMKEELQTKPGEENGIELVTEPVNRMTESGISNNGLEVPLGESLEEVGIKVEKIKVETSSSIESIGMSESLSYARILKTISHNPHFIPLQNYSKRAQEKLISGWDQIFEETFDQIQSLTAETFWANVDEMWKTLEELDSMGYDVARLRKRLDELTDVMMKRKSSLVEITNVKIKAEDYMKKKRMIEMAITDLQAQADKTQLMVDELMNQVDKLESNLPAVDALFESLAMNPL